MEMREMIAALASQRAPAGFERGAHQTAAELLRPFVDDLETDVLGNLIGKRRCGVEGAPVVMLDAHLDEVGLIVTGYEGAFLRFDSIGGVDERILPAAEVVLLAPEGPIRGVIDALPPHVVPESEREKPVPMEKLFIDAGFSDGEQAAERVPRGTPAVYATPCFAMGEHLLAGKSLDDRSCAAILIAAMQKLHGKTLAADVAVHLAAQEEVGGRGALTGAWGVDPDYALAVDVTFGTAPGTPADRSCRLGGGTAIGLGPAAARTVSDKLIAVAEKRGIPYQLEVMGGRSGTDADEIQTTRGGVATGLVSLPLRYMHTPTEIIDLRDAEAAAELIAAWIESFGEED